MAQPINTRKDWENVEIRTLSPKPGIIVLDMSGSIHMGPDCRRIDQEVEAHLAKGAKNIVFDLSRVTHVESAAIGLIVRTHTHLLKAGGGLRLAGAKGMVRSVLEMTQVDKVIGVLPSAAEAVESFSGAS
ncbi:MAG TPA: STAS domain-containing protein [Candidatus Acidoferrum sp.]|nr:STAS domain-containing protein [Candidatus Acidoferrum sp.]